MAAGPQDDLKKQEEERRRKNKCWYKFTQQKLPAWQPVLTPKCTLIIFYSFSFLFVGIGGMIFNYSSQIKRIVIDYTKVDSKETGE